LKLRYTNTTDDAVAFSLFVASESPELARAVNSARWSAWIASIVTIAAYSFREPSAGVIAAGLIAGGVFGAVFGEAWRWLVKRNVAKAAGNAVGEHFRCEHELALAGSELVETTHSTEQRIRFDAIHRVARTDRHTFIFTDKAYGHVVPATVPASELEPFLSELEARRQGGA
jgi:hypothetical protein